MEELLKVLQCSICLADQIVHSKILCFDDYASLYNLINKANLVQNLFLVYIYS